MPILTALTAVLAVAPPDDLVRKTARMYLECANVPEGVFSSANDFAEQLAKTNDKRPKSVKAIREWASGLGGVPIPDKCLIRILDLAIAENNDAEKQKRADKILALRASLTDTERRWLAAVKTARTREIKKITTELARYQSNRLYSSAAGHSEYLRDRLNNLARKDSTFIPALFRVEFDPRGALLKGRVGAMGTLTAISISEIVAEGETIVWDTAHCFWLSGYEVPRFTYGEQFLVSGIFEVIGTKIRFTDEGQRLTYPHVVKVELDHRKLHRLARLEGEK